MHTAGQDPILLPLVLQIPPNLTRHLTHPTIQPLIPNVPEYNGANFSRIWQAEDIGIGPSQSEGWGYIFLRF